MGSRMSKCWKIIQENKMLFLQDACIETATKQRMSAKRLSFYEINLFVFFFLQIFQCHLIKVSFQERRGQYKLFFH